MKSSQPLYRLIYVSRNVLSGPAAEMEHEVARVLDVSRRNNWRDGVTGALLFNEDCFAQLLEGPAVAVHQVFERIQLDPRHRGTVVLECGVVQQREFAAWSMAYAGRVPAERARYAALAEEASRGDAPGSIMALLRDVVARAEAH